MTKTTLTAIISSKPLFSKDENNIDIITLAMSLGLDSPT
jgi:hypothetical protein